MDPGKRSETIELLAMILLAALLRLFAGRNALSDKGIIFSGYDEFYHMRRILYTANNFPHTLWFDSYLNYPHGLEITWPPLFDLIAAVLSLGLGQHTQQGIEMVSAFLPVILGALVVLVVYYLVRETFDNNTALLAAFMTAIAPFHIPKTMIGATDHHSLEVLLMVGSLLFLVIALSRKEKRYIFSAAASVMIAGMAYTWFGAVIYLALLPIFAAVQITLDLRAGKSSREIIVTLLTVLGGALILLLPFWNATWLWPSFLGITAAIAGIALMFALSILAIKQQFSWKAFPFLLLIFAAASILLAPYLGLEGLMYSGSDYVFGGQLSGKISEAASLFSNTESVFYISLASSLGWKLILNLVLSSAGIVAFILYIREGDVIKRSSRIVILLWVILTLILTVAQIRFLYISTIAMGILISLLFFRMIMEIERWSKTSGRQVPRFVAAILLFLLILPSLAQTMSLSSSIPPITGDWQESLIWLEENSNKTSFYEEPFQIPEYSVMSLWDYGNWIVYGSQRPVVANNFQAGIGDSMAFFLSESESEAIAIINARNSKYIITDRNMLYGKLPSIARWANEDIYTYLNIEDYGSSVAAIPLPRLLNTTMAKLHLFDGTGLGHFRLIYESATLTGANPPDSMVKIFEYVPGAVIRVKTGSNQRVGALINLTSNQQRPFTYVNEGLQKDGYFEVVVPYSSEAGYETHASGPYLLFSGNEQGVKMLNLDVSERDVLEGRTIDVSF